jgi:hypothetical protein
MVLSIPSSVVTGKHIFIINLLGAISASVQNPATFSWYGLETSLRYLP